MKKLLSLLLVAVMVMSTFAVGAAADNAANTPADYVPVDAADTARYNAASKWDGTVYTVTALANAYTFDGEGTEASPWLIKSADDLAKLAANVRFTSTETNYEGKYFKLTCDIDMQHHEWWGIGGCFIDGVKWGAVASNPNLEMFAGIFYGDNHVIYNFNLAGSTQDGKYLCGNGLFGYAGGGAEIYDIGIVNGDISMTNASRIAALIGASRYDLVVKNCFNRANLTFVYEAGVKYSDNRAAEARVGGLMGAVMNDNSTERSIENCYNSGNVTVTLAEGINSYAVGGIMGYLSDGVDNVFTNCVNTGTITVNANHGAAPDNGRITVVSSLVGTLAFGGYCDFVDCKAGGTIVYNNTNSEASGTRIGAFLGYLLNASWLTLKGENEYSVVIEPDAAIGNLNSVAEGKVTKVASITLTFAEDGYFMGEEPTNTPGDTTNPGDTTTPGDTTPGGDNQQGGSNDDNTQTQAPETNAPETNTTTTTAPVEEESGCASVVASGMLIALLTVGGATLCIRKKKED